MASAIPRLSLPSLSITINCGELCSCLGAARLLLSLKSFAEASHSLSCPKGLGFWNTKARDSQTSSLSILSYFHMGQWTQNKLSVKVVKAKGENIGKFNISKLCSSIDTTTVITIAISYFITMSTTEDIMRRLMNTSTSKCDQLESNEKQYRIFGICMCTIQTCFLLKSQRVFLSRL